MKIGLGIDAGGTYTDSVLLDFTTGRVLGKAKSLTTHHRLTDGIAGSVSRLDRALLRTVELVALSTTLATNSIVEGRGAPAGLILLGYDEHLTSRLELSPFACVRGRLDITGEEIEPLDEDGVLNAVRYLFDEHRAQAVAISGMCSVMNPAHELRAAEIVRHNTPSGFPIVCGHELTLELDALRRATTALLNARLVPVLRELMSSTKSALRQLGVSAPLMVVRGDGSLMTEEAAARRPVETILSGPAASVVGARALTGLQDALVVDMGGTTTDVAVISEGEPGVSPRGATVGGIRTSVRAAEIRTCGLGGDSHVWLKDGEVMVGPRRAVPIAYLAHEDPGVLPQLHDLAQADVSPLVQPCDFLVLVRPDALPHDLTAVERRIAQALADGPKSQWHLARLGCASHPALLTSSRLEACGAVRRSSLTPTDVLHAQGRLSMWSPDASRLAAELYARRLGIGTEELYRRVAERIRRTAALEILARCMPGSDHRAKKQYPADPAVLDSLFGDGEGPIRWSVRTSLPLVGVGAPAATWLAPVAEVLGTELIVPPHAEVANAVGAVSGTLIFRESARIGLDIEGRYVVHSGLAKSLHSSLEAAKERAVEDVRALLHRRIQIEGVKGVEFRITVDARDHYADAGEGQRVFVECQVAGTAVGKPSFA